MFHRYVLVMFVVHRAMIREFEWKKKTDKHRGKEKGRLVISGRPVREGEMPAR